MSGPAAAKAAGGQDHPQLTQGLPGVELMVPAPNANGPQTGATITIPGLGSFGTLPKLDFGLELLYGSPETTTPGETPSGEELPDAFTVHGSVKKTF